LFQQYRKIKRGVQLEFIAAKGIYHREFLSEKMNHTAEKTDYDI